jgi:GT2 family glycosyltransferase
VVDGSTKSSKESYPLVSIVVLNYNGKHHLKTCLDSLLRTKYPNFEVILVDNGSTDESVKFVKENYPNVNIVKLRKNVYSVGGYMAGVLAAKGKYVAILNNDIEVDENWLTPLVEALEKMPWVAAADAKYKSFYQRDLFNDTAAAGRLIDYFGNNYTRGVKERDLGQYDKPVYIMGVLTIFRRDLLLRIGGFDLLYIFGYEDIDIAWRLYLAGYKALYVPQSIIYHKSGASTKNEQSSCRPRPEFFYLNKRNRIVTLIKNYSLANVFKALIVIFFEYYITALYFFLTGDMVYGVQMIRALLYPFKNLKKVVAKRVHVQRLRTCSDKVIMKYMVPYSGDVVRVLGMLG